MNEDVHAQQRRAELSAHHEGVGDAEAGAEEGREEQQGLEPTHAVLELLRVRVRVRHAV